MAKIAKKGKKEKERFTLLGAWKRIDWVSRIARLRTWIWKHLVWSVLLFIVSMWMICAYGVWQAEIGVKDANINSFADGVWWGIVTLLTVGYGDKFPLTMAGREIATALMVSGVGCVGIITAKISSIFLEQALRDGRGLVDSSKLKDHFVVCGWNENMYELLTHILDFNPQMTSEEIVVIANVEQTAIDAVVADGRLDGLHVIMGDHFSEMNIRRAAPDKAKKVLILADRLVGPTGQIPTATEVDARTIMTAMTISNVARGTLVTAEILDPKMDHYLKLANVSEIIYSSEYSRLLLGNASSGTGIANIVLDLLDSKAGAHITSVDILETLIGKKYLEVKTVLEDMNPHLLVIGILENSGNSHAIKELALRRAQQTPDMKQLVNNLRGVRDLRCNKPVFHPGDDHIVTEGAMAIVIAKRVTGRKRDSGQATALSA